MVHLPFIVIFLEFFLLFFYIENPENDQKFWSKNPKMNPRWIFLFMKSWIAVIYSISNQFETYPGLQWRVLAKNGQKIEIFQVMHAASCHKKFPMAMKLTRNVLYMCLMNLWKYKTFLERHFSLIDFLRPKIAKNGPKMHIFAKKCMKEVSDGHETYTKCSLYLSNEFVKI